MNKELKDQKTVIVLGSPRSGTSATSGILKILGVAMDTGFDSTEDEYRNFNNPKGFFESKNVNNLNEKLFNLIAGKKDFHMEYSFLVNCDSIDKYGNKIENDIEKFVLEASKNWGIWGWKDPKTSLTMELFLPYVINPYLVIVRRASVKTAESMADSKMTKNLQEGVKLADFYDKSIKEFLSNHVDLPKIFVDYETLIKFPIQESKKLADFLELQLDNKKEKEIRNFVIQSDQIDKEKQKVKFKMLILGFLSFVKKVVQEPTKVFHYIKRAIRAFIGIIFNK